MNQPERGRRPGIVAALFGALWILLKLTSRIEIWATEQAMIREGASVCRSTAVGYGVLLFAATTPLPTLFISCVGLTLAVVSRVHGSNRWSSVGLLLNAVLLGSQLLEIAGVAFLRHPCAR